MPLAAAPVGSKSRFALSTPMFTASLVCLCLDEAFAIHGLWFRSQPASHRLRGFDLPFLMWIPALVAFLLVLSIRRMARSGKINASLAESLSSGVALLLLISYLLLTRLAQIAFR
jgi:hypothetical protein